MSSACAEDQSHIGFSATETTMGSASSNDRLHELRFRIMSNFEISSCDLLRATPAGHPLRFFGAALRHTEQLRPPSNIPAETDVGSDSDDFHPWSRPVMWIHEFWSHSWHAAVLSKVMVLLLEYNGIVATAVGTIAAFVGSALFAAGVLPRMVKNPWFKDPLRKNIEVERACWGVVLGVLFFVVTLLCWRSGRRVFLDKICISQVNERKKLDAVLGIGAFLKASHCMLVLVDPTYVNRLWCTFEMAAFSKLMDSHPDKVLRFVPVPYGSYFISVFITDTVVVAFYLFLTSQTTVGAILVIVSGIVLGSIGMDLLRKYQDVVAQLKGQMEDFSFHASQCYCCSVGHVHPDTGARLPCDRVAVGACVDAWFGSSQAFDTLVQRRLFDKFARDLSRTGVTYKQALMLHLPSVWLYLDEIAFMVRRKEWDGTLLKSVEAVYVVAIGFPLVLACQCAMAYRVRRRLNSRFVNALISLGITIAGFVVFPFLVIPSVIEGMGVATTAVCFIVFGFLTVWVYCGSAGCRLFGACTSGSPFRAETELCVDGPEEVAFHADV